MISFPLAGWSFECFVAIRVADTVIPIEEAGRCNHSGLLRHNRKPNLRVVVRLGNVEIQALFPSATYQYSIFRLRSVLEDSIEPSKVAGWVICILLGLVVSGIEFLHILDQVACAFVLHY